MGNFAVLACTHTEISGIPGSLVEHHIRTSGAGLVAAGILLFMVPPCAIKASVIETARKRSH
jgi:hypothetical protein